MRTKDELFRAAQREVAARRQRAVMQAEDARRAAFAAHPGLAAADDAQMHAGLALAKAAALGGDVEAARAALTQADAALADAAKAAGYDEAAFAPAFACPLCHDTGMYQGVPCRCVADIARRLRREEIDRIPAICREPPIRRRAAGPAVPLVWRRRLRPGPWYRISCGAWGWGACWALRGIWQTLCRAAGRCAVFCGISRLLPRRPCWSAALRPGSAAAAWPAGIWQPARWRALWPGTALCAKGCAGRWGWLAKRQPGRFGRRGAGCAAWRCGAPRYGGAPGRTAGIKK